MRVYGHISNALHLCKSDPNCRLDLKKLIDDARDKVSSAKGPCKDLLGDNAVNNFNRIAKTIQYDTKGTYVRGSAAARTIKPDIYLNAWSHVFNPDARVPLPENKNTHKSIKAQNETLQKYQDLLKSSGVSAYDFALATLLHEFMHATGTWPDDSHTTQDSEGYVHQDSAQSQKNQLIMLRKCFGAK